MFYFAQSFLPWHVSQGELPSPLLSPPSCSLWEKTQTLINQTPTQVEALTAREIEEGYAVRTADLVIDNTQVTIEA